MIIIITPRGEREGDRGRERRRREREGERGAKPPSGRACTAGRETRTEEGGTWPCYVYVLRALRQGDVFFHLGSVLVAMI